MTGPAFHRDATCTFCAMPLSDAGSGRARYFTHFDASYSSCRTGRGEQRANVCAVGPSRTRLAASSRRTGPGEWEDGT